MTHFFEHSREYKYIRKFLPSSLHPRHKKPYVLITSHDQKWDSVEEGDIKVIRLNEFCKTEACEFVKKALNIEDNLQDQEIEELTEKLQYVPLALKQATVYICNKNKKSKLRGYGRFEVSDYLKEYSAPICLDHFFQSDPIFKMNMLINTSTHI